MEYELLDTGIFDDDRYFDVIVEYAKARHDDILMVVTAHNRGPDPATLHLLPTLWFRNTWSWGDEVPRPSSTGSTTVTGSRSLARLAPRARRLAVLRGRLGGAAVLRERDEQRAPVRRAERLAVRQGRHQRLRRRRPPRTRSTPSTPAPRWPRTTCSSSRPARARRSAFGLTAARRAANALRPSRSGPASTACCAPAASEADHFYDPGHPGRARAPTRRW